MARGIMGPSVRPPPPTGNERWTTYLTKRPPSAARQRAACERLAAPWRHKRVDGNNGDVSGREAHTPRAPPPAHPPASPALEQRRCREPASQTKGAAPTGVLRPVLEAFNRADARLGAMTGGTPSGQPSSHQGRPPAAPQQRRSSSLHAASRGQPQSARQAAGASIVANQGSQTPRGAATPVTPRQPAPAYPAPQGQADTPAPPGRPLPTPGRAGSRTPPNPPDSVAVVPPLKVPPPPPGAPGAGGPTPRRTAREQRAACERLSVPRSRPDTPGQRERERPQSPVPSKRPGRGAMQGRVPRLMRRLNESASWLSEDGSGGSEDEECSGDEDDRKQALPANVRQMFCLHEMLNESATWIPCDVSESGEDDSPNASPRHDQALESDNVFVGNFGGGRARSASF
eukprot:gnl/MRDRNA2_/MRDRNA2_121306_c0_seq1.p1 gnl/MRDRNA2_/MRDRNA2_121306_c0~~gnl/MRDRNA2_/MRDRNA2_121306_c0_seq1.p1  ORF type:complete len:401 (-),score=62.43 gnl/MRDRNA2_/MRDRNA2_121306_c0_seq1:141-1343(-)